MNDKLIIIIAPEKEEYILTIEEFVTRKNHLQGIAWSGPELRFQGTYKNAKEASAALADWFNGVIIA